MCLYVVLSYTCRPVLLVLAMINRAHFAHSSVFSAAFFYYTGGTLPSRRECRRCHCSTTDRGCICIACVSECFVCLHVCVSACVCVWLCDSLASCHLCTTALKAARAPGVSFYSILHTISLTPYTHSYKYSHRFTPLVRLLTYAQQL